MTAPAPSRTLLFVPGTRPDRFTRALASGADAVIIDLEDAVAPDAKAEARRHIETFAEGHPGVAFLVRVNGTTTPWFAEDLRLCRGLPDVAGLVLPKAESADQVMSASASGKPVFPIIESAAGLHALDGIAGVGGLGRLVFGALDLSLDLGIAPDTHGASILLDQARFQLVLQSRVSELAAPVDGVWPDVADAEGLALAARRARDMGFGGLLCIHPAQVSVVHRAFAPDATELAWARRVVAEADRLKSYAFKLDGKMVDRPVIERARRVVERAGS